MKKAVFWLLFFVSGICGEVCGQTLINLSALVIPGDNWMYNHDYMKEAIVDGKLKYVPLYAKAMIESTDMISVIQSMQQLLEEKGIECRDFNSELKKLDVDLYDPRVLEIMEDKLNPQIIIDVDYTSKSISKKDVIGPKKISWRVTATDVSTRNIIASVEDNIRLTMETAEVAMRKAINKKMEEFTYYVMRYYLSKK